MDVEVTVTLRVPPETDPADVRTEVHSVVYAYLHGEGVDEWRVL